MHKISLITWPDLEPLTPTYALAAGVDLVVVRWPDEEQVSVLYGRCAHRGAMMSDGRIEGGSIVCGLHDWDYCYKSGISSYNPAERLLRFNAWLEDGQVWVDEDEIRAWTLGKPPSPMTETLTRGSTRTTTAVRKNLTTNISSTWPSTALTRWGTMAESAPWACRATSCQCGSRSNS